MTKLSENLLKISIHTPMYMYFQKLIRNKIHPKMSKNYLWSGEPLKHPDCQCSEDSICIGQSETVEDIISCPFRKL